MAGTTILCCILGNMMVVLSVITMAILCSRCRSGLVHLLVGIVTVRLLVVPTLVAYISLGASLVEVALVGIVAVDVDGPATVLPSQRTIE